MHFAPNDSWITYLVIHTQKGQPKMLGGKYYKGKGRKAELYLNAGERLIGAEVDHNGVFVFGVTFIMLKKLK